MAQKQTAHPFNAGGRLFDCQGDRSKFSPVLRRELNRRSSSARKPGRSRWDGSSGDDEGNASRGSTWERSS